MSSVVFKVVAIVVAQVFSCRTSIQLFEARLIDISLLITLKSLIGYPKIYYH